MSRIAYEDAYDSDTVFGVIRLWTLKLPVTLLAATWAAIFVLLMVWGIVLAMAPGDQGVGVVAPMLFFLLGSIGLAVLTAGVWGLYRLVRWWIDVIRDAF